MITTDTFLKEASPAFVSNVYVKRDGNPIFEYHWDADIRLNQYSASKSIASLAMGLAIEEGLFTLDSFVYDLLPSAMQKNCASNWKKTTVRHLLTMCTGHETAPLMGIARYDLEEKDWFLWALQQNAEQTPGTVFKYGNIGPYVAGVLLQLHTGQNLVEFLMPRFFEPLGITLPTWETDPIGRTFAASGLLLRPSEMARIGELLLHHGVYQNKRILPADWIALACHNQVDTIQKAADDVGYGYLFWTDEAGIFKAEGKYGQFCAISPKNNTVAVVNASTKNTKALWQLIKRSFLL